MQWDLYSPFANSLRPTIISHSRNEVCSFRHYNQLASNRLDSTSLISHLFYLTMQEIISVHIRRGGINKGQSHTQWLSTVSQSPNVISMSFVPIASLLSGLRGSGFLSHAINLYLRCEYNAW